jgi:ABC-type transport system involved in cytochrome c biogenesis permease subunit
VFEVFTRFHSLKSIFLGESLRVIPGSGPNPQEWFSFVDREKLTSNESLAAVEQWRGFLEAYDQGDGARASALVAPLVESLRAVNAAGYPRDAMIGYEVTLNETRPFFWGTWLYFLSFALFLGSFIGPAKLFRAVALAVAGLGATVHVAGMWLRVLAAERPPVTNIPESLVWISFGVFLFATVFELIYKNRFFGSAGTALAGLGLLYYNFCPFPTSIGPIMPVLRSNYWLTVHVLTITISYAALILAGGLGAIYVWCRVFNVKAKGIYPTLMQSLFPAIYIGVLLITAGIILGGVWANESWGRYWGWDPKETWAFITLLWFLAIVHARMAGYAWFKGLAVAGATVFGAGLTLFTWWGVNFIPWFVGLHSYAGASAEGFKLSNLPPEAIASGVVVLATLGAALVKGLLSRGLPGVESAPREEAKAPSVSGAVRPGVRPI